MAEITPQNIGQEVGQAAAKAVAVPAQYVQYESAQLKTYAATHYMAVFAFLGILVAGLGGYVAIRYADKLIARADAAQDHYEADKKVWQQELDNTRTQYAQIVQAQAGQSRVIVEREQSTAQTVAQVTAPNQTAQGVADNSTKYLGVTPDVTPDGKLAYLSKDVQDFIANKVNLDALQLNYDDQGTILSEEKDKNTLLQGTITAKDAQIKESEAVVKDYKAAAKASKWKKTLHGIEIGAAIVATAYLSHTF
jgi:hypothetical protein